MSNQNDRTADLAFLADRSRRKVRLIDKRRNFVDPPCRSCGSANTKYVKRGRLGVAAKCGDCGSHIKNFNHRKVPARVKLAVRPENVFREIKYGKRPTEFEIQAYLYTELRRLGYDARGEVTTKDGDCRFDIVVFANKRKPARIIEVKSCRKKYRSRQLDQYRAYGIKVISICGMEQAQALIERAAAAGKKTPLPLLVWL